MNYLARPSNAIKSDITAMTTFPANTAHADENQQEAIAFVSTLLDVQRRQLEHYLLTFTTERKTHLRATMGDDVADQVARHLSDLKIAITAFGYRAATTD